MDGHENLNRGNTDYLELRIFISRGPIPWFVKTLHLKKNANGGALPQMWPVPFARRGIN